VIIRRLISREKLFVGRKKVEILYILNHIIINIHQHQHKQYNPQMKFAVHTVDGTRVIMLDCAKVSEKNTRCVCVRIKEEESVKTGKVYELLITNDVYSFIVNGAKGSDKIILESACEEYGRDTVTPDIVIAALCAVDPTFSLSCAELVAMAKPVHPNFYIIDYCDGYDGGDGDRCDDKSDDGNHSDCGNDISNLEYQFALNIPLLPLNGRCGRCFDGKLVKAGHGHGMWPWSMCCANCGQAS
jgi:hypothetical protein